ncbi:hypothetical protein PR048_027336 [Dryococelus australis]|uniref:Uncharacterized protein n=1 Tax=Dryococelus australis TaxID=614101 RepID=A0ABQ9GGC8_9NEOP|nr:hypothetical protein PR048_027336 [Dryococelus australis]
MASLGSKMSGRRSPIRAWQLTRLPADYATRNIHFVARCGKSDAGLVPRASYSQSDVLSCTTVKVQICLIFVNLVAPTICRADVTRISLLIGQEVILFASRSSARLVELLCFQRKSRPCPSKGVRSERGRTVEAKAEQLGRTTWASATTWECTEGSQLYQPCGLCPVVWCHRFTRRRLRRGQAVTLSPQEGAHANTYNKITMCNAALVVPMISGVEGIPTATRRKHSLSTAGHYHEVMITTQRWIDFMCDIPSKCRHNHESIGFAVPRNGIPRENPPTDGIVRHDTHMRKSGLTLQGIEPGLPWWEASRLTSQSPWPRERIYSGAISFTSCAVAERLACSPPTKTNRVQPPAGSLPDFHKSKSCRTMPLVGGSSPGISRSTPPPPTLAFRRRSIHPHAQSTGTQAQGNNCNTTANTAMWTRQGVSLIMFCSGVWRDENIRCCCGYAIITKQIVAPSEVVQQSNIPLEFERTISTDSSPVAGHELANLSTLRRSPYYLHYHAKSK